MKAGKLPPQLLANLLARLPQHPRVLVGPAPGVDAAAIDIGGGRALVATSDPITFATSEIGRYAVHVNANDVACLGAAPLWFIATILLPEGAAPALAESIFEQIRTTCEELGIALIGGHSEVTLGIDRPIVAGTMLGEAAVDDLVRPERAAAGDHVLLTKGIAIEGTALLAREAPGPLRAAGLDEATLSAASRLLIDPGIGVLRDARVACDAARVHALHDPTEGGLATALLELAQATRCGLRVRPSDVPIREETRSICDALGLEPMGLLASGALLIVVAPEDCDRVRSAFATKRVSCACIGELAGQGSEVIIDQNGHPLPRFERDEVARFFETLGEGETG